MSSQVRVSGLVRPSVWRASFWYGALFGFLYGSGKDLLWNISDLPAWSALEAKKRDVWLKERIAEKDKQIEAFHATTSPSLAE